MILWSHEASLRTNLDVIRPYLFITSSSAEKGTSHTSSTGYSYGAGHIMLNTRKGGCVIFVHFVLFTNAPSLTLADSV